MADHLVDPDVPSVSRRLKLLRIGNTVSFLFFFGAIVAGSLVHPSVTVSYFTPHHLFVEIFWAILFLLQLVFVFYAQYNNLHVVQKLVSHVVTFIHTPFSMYAAFTLLDALHGGFVAFTDTDKVYQILACVAVWALAIIGIGWTTVGWWSEGRRDGVFGTTIACLAVQQRDVLFLSIQAIVLAIVQLLTIIFVWLRFGGAYSSKSTSEQQPLLQE
ncbi:9293_t:CDS:2 [Ambispora gerdemannii]|uniref:9293_t:CDS:1 n=1 Tax=Ambispora gerdemannii TaxID=144530 RepID=A0A9N8V770_9GLOM|nr:9293_t:CDS:2 [Ambispora gerdemannii]